MERTSIEQLKIQALFLFGYGKLFEIYSDTHQTFIYRQVPNIYHSLIKSKSMPLLQGVIVSRQSPMSL